MTLVIPGVEVKVVKEVVAPQLSPTGILGLTGLTEKIPAVLTPVGSWTAFIAAFGAASAYSLPEAYQAIANGVAELVVSPVAAGDAQAAAAAADVSAETGMAPAVHVTARARGLWGNALSVAVSVRTLLDATKVADIQVTGAGGAVLEVMKNLPVGPGAPPLDAAINERSILLRASAAVKDGIPKAGAYPLTGGADASPAGYRDALAVLENDPDIDMVIAGIQDFGKPAQVAAIYSDVIGHCNRMSTGSHGRLGFGQVDTAGTIPSWITLADNLRSERFVLLAPNGVAGAVAGMIGGLDYFQSPTFKTATGLTQLSRVLTVEEQKQLLQASIVPVANQRGRGTIVLRGLTTDGDQISVRRVADHAVRGVKMIGDLFIGRLNNADGRGALQEKLREFLVQMEREGAIVPSTDGKEPAYMVAVHSSQDDFSKGIVRVDMAVRPVRAIDFIYATVLVQA